LVVSARVTETGDRVMVAVADFEGSATEVAVTVVEFPETEVRGATYRPEVLTDPAPQVQTTDSFTAPVTVGVKVADSPAKRDLVMGVMDTTTVWGVTVMGRVVLPLTGFVTVRVWVTGLRVAVKLDVGVPEVTAVPPIDPVPLENVPVRV